MYILKIDDQFHSSKLQNYIKYISTNHYPENILIVFILNLMHLNFYSHVHQQLILSTIKMEVEDFSCFFLIQILQTNFNY